MRQFSPPAASLILAGILTAGLVSCGPPSETGTDSAGSPAAAAADASDGGGAEDALSVPPEFTAPIGDDFVLGEERVDDASGLDDEDVEVRTYQPIQISPDSSLLDYEITEDYALQDPDWIGMMEFPDDVSDAAMGTASRFVVETWMDSPIYWEDDPERNTAWFEQNKHAFGEDIHEAVVEDLTSPGERVFIVGAWNPNPDGSSVAGVTGMAPAYDIAPTRWTDIDITPTLAIGTWGDGGDDPTEYAYVSFHVTANQLLMMQATDSESTDSDRAPQARPFEANVGISVVRYEGNDEWQIYGIRSHWSAVGDPVAELEHPWN